MSGPVLFFDGECNLCNGAVQFVIRHDRNGVIRFAALQSVPGKVATTEVQKKYGRVPDSIILLEAGNYYVESDAALHLTAYLDGGWKLLRYLRIFPRILRDFVYGIVSRNRYRWFGKRDECMIPTPALRSRFIQE